MRTGSMNSSGVTILDDEFAASEIGGQLDDQSGKGGWTLGVMDERVEMTAPPIQNHFVKLSTNAICVNAEFPGGGADDVKQCGLPVRTGKGESGMLELEANMVVVVDRRVWVRICDRGQELCFSGMEGKGDSFSGECRDVKTGVREIVNGARADSDGLRHGIEGALKKLWESVVGPWGRSGCEHIGGGDWAGVLYARMLTGSEIGESALREK